MSRNSHTGNGANSETIIRLEKVRRRFGPLVVLDGIDLEVRRGSTTVVIGPSGCGKSVLLKHIVGLLKPDSGHIFLNGHEVSALSERDLVPIRRKVGFVFQGGALFDSMDVEGNVCFPLVEHTPAGRRDIEDRCRRALRLVGLDGCQQKMPAELSGGQRKRVSLARAIVLEPELILYDEPTTGLDPVRADLINELIIKLQKELNTTAVVVTHDLASARKVGNRVVMLYDGHIIADARPDELEAVQDEVVRRFVKGQADSRELQELAEGRQGEAEIGPPPVRRGARRK